MYSMIFRTTVMFFLVMFVMRLMGKKNLGEFQPSDLVSTILISNLTSLVIEAPELPLLFSIVPILLIMCYEIFVSLAIKKSEKIANITQGRSMVLINGGVINQQTMNDLRFTVDDVLEAMRGKDIFYLEEVCLAIVETTGAVNIYPDPNAKTNIKKSKTPQCAVVIDGKLEAENLMLTGFDEGKVTEILSRCNADMSKVLLLLLDGDGQYNLTLKSVSSSFLGKGK
ncbi:MAG: DUF421 domain-containing protein [Oscillospiraceae bacterium]